MADAPGSYTGEERGVKQTPAYGYVIEHASDGARQFFTGWERNVFCSNLPARFAADDPQEFMAVQIKHGEVQLSASWDKRTVQVTIASTDSRLRRFFISAAAVKIGMSIIRFNTARLLDESPAVDYLTDAIMVNSGLIGAVSFAGQTISAAITPEPYLSDQAVPRHYFERTCNHIFGGPACTAVKPTQVFEIATIDRQARRLTMTTAAAPHADFYSSGTILLPDGQLMAVVSCDNGGPAGVCRLVLRFWNPTLVEAMDVTATAGCNHTTAHCQTRFANQANFGGFPFVPNRNPTIHGVAG